MSRQSVQHSRDGVGLTDGGQGDASEMPRGDEDVRHRSPTREPCSDVATEVAHTPLLLRVKVNQLITGERRERSTGFGFAMRNQTALGLRSPSFSSSSVSATIIRSNSPRSRLSFAAWTWECWSPGPQ